jgi:hypothetical protein
MNEYIYFFGVLLEWFDSSQTPLIISSLICWMALLQPVNLCINSRSTGTGNLYIKPGKYLEIGYIYCYS